VFTLWRNDQFVLEHDSRGKPVLKLKKTLNLETGKMSAKNTDFGDANWGKATRSYMSSINRLPEQSIDDIIRDVQAFVNARKSSTLIDSGDENVLDDMEEYDERANLLDV
jgi:hypothetical protein